MITKYSIGIGILLFGAGLVSGMFAQRLIAPAVDKELQPVVTAAEPEHASLKSPAMPRPEPPTRDENVDWSEPVPGSRAEPTQVTPQFSERQDRDERRPPWDREAWTNREAWLEQRRIERQARMDSMRSNLVQQAKLSEEQAVRFDVLVSAMNLRLQEQAQIWQTALEVGTMSRPEVRARAMKEVGTVVALTYDELDRNMPTDWRTETTNEAVNLWTFVDPDIWREMRPVMGGGRPPRPPSSNP